MIKVNDDIRIIHTARFSVLWQRIKESGYESPRINELILKAAIESGIVIGCEVSEVDTMKTGQVITLSNKAIKAYVAELKPAFDPN